MVERTRTGRRGRPPRDTPERAIGRKVKHSKGEHVGAAARSLFDNLMAAPIPTRRLWWRDLDAAGKTEAMKVALLEGGTPYAIWRDDPVGFVEDVIGDSLWSKPRTILGAIPFTRRIAVPSCFSSSKSHSMARACLWHSNVHPVGTARTVTLAPLWRQVSGIMWGQEIRGAHARAQLPGEVGDVTYKIRTNDGPWQKVAEGIVGNPRNEASVQGLHAPSVLILVDEAGGIPHGVGRNLNALLSADETRMVAIGNPPADDEGSWFEQLCDRDDVLTVRISALDTPNFTGERSPRCRSCPSTLPPHPLSKHLASRQFVAEVARDYGVDSNYYQAKVLAHFPRGGSDRVLPSLWVDAAVDAPEPDQLPGYDPDQWVRLCDLGLEHERDKWLVRRGAWIRLGVDVAADGGDELVIARSVGDLVTIRHTSSGAGNAHGVTVAGKVLAEIQQAMALAVALGSPTQIRVKVDGIGLGWTITSLLDAWGPGGTEPEPLHSAAIVPVIVSESVADPKKPDGAAMRTRIKRDEMWVSFRPLIQPDDEGLPQTRLRVDRRTAAQLATPAYRTAASGGWTVVERKKEIRDRGLSSPDRAEAVLLCVYEGATAKKKGLQSRLLV